MWTEALRLETTDYPDEADCAFPDETSLMIDRERRVAVQEQGAHFETIAFVVLLYKPPPKLTQRFFDLMLDRPEGNTDSLEEKNFQKFRKTGISFEGALGTIFPVRRLVPYTDARGRTFCDFCRLLHYCATGIMRPVRVPDPRIGIDSLICGQDFYPSFSPRVGQQYVGIVSVEGVQSYTTPAMLAAFDSRPLRYRWSTRFLYMDRIDAIDSLAAFRRKWKQKEVGIKDQLLQNPNPRVNLDAVRMVSDADEAFAEVSSGDVNQGLYTSVFVIYSKSLEELRGRDQLLPELPDRERLRRPRRDDERDKRLPRLDPGQRLGERGPDADLDGEPGGSHARRHGLAGGGVRPVRQVPAALAAADPGRDAELAPRSG